MGPGGGEGADWRSDGDVAMAKRRGSGDGIVAECGGGGESGVWLEGCVNS